MKTFGASGDGGEVMKHFGSVPGCHATFASLEIIE